MSETSVRTDIYNVVKAVSNVGNVYDYERWAAFHSGQIDIAKTTIGGASVLRFWTVSCQSISQEHATFGGDIFREYTYVISGAFGLDDANASEKAAIAIVEDVMEALDADTSIHADLTGGSDTMAQLRIFELRLIGTEFCHFAEIIQKVTEQT